MPKTTDGTSAADTAALALPVLSASRRSRRPGPPPRDGARSWRQVLFVATLAFSAAACKGRPPPFERFEVALEAPLPGGQATPKPPAAALRPWRVWVNQSRPRQAKNPEWRAHDARQGAMLELAADGRWRCLVNPAQLLGHLNDHAQVGEWTVTRTLRCSTDGFQTYVEGLVRVGFDPSGTPVVSEPPAALYLGDRVAGQARVTEVVLKSEVAPIQRQRE